MSLRSEGVRGNSVFSVCKLRGQGVFRAQEVAETAEPLGTQPLWPVSQIEILK